MHNDIFLLILMQKHSQISWICTTEMKLDVGHMLAVGQYSRVTLTARMDTSLPFNMTALALWGG